MKIFAIIIFCLVIGIALAYLNKDYLVLWYQLKSKPLTAEQQKIADELIGYYNKYDLELPNKTELVSEVKNIIDESDLEKKFVEDKVSDIVGKFEGFTIGTTVGNLSDNILDGRYSLETLHDNIAKSYIKTKYKQAYTENVPEHILSKFVEDVKKADIRPFVLFETLYDKNPPEKFSRSAMPVNMNYKFKGISPFKGKK